MRDAKRKKRPDKFSKYPLEVQEIVSGFIANLKTVTSLQDIQSAIKERFRIKCPLQNLSLFLRKRMGIVYKRVGVLTPQHNLSKNLLQRQYAASKYIEILDSGKIIINIDESNFRCTDSRRMSWIFSRTYNLPSFNQRLNKINIIAALFSDG